MKKVLKLSEKIENTHQLRIKIKEYEKIPEDKHEGFVSYSKIDDDVSDPDNTRLTVIFTTGNLSFIRSSECHMVLKLLHVFADCEEEDCKESVRLMCWSHVYR